MMFTLDEIEQEMRKLEARYKATRHGPAFYFKALVKKLKALTPHWRVSIKGGTAYTYVYVDSSNEAIEKAREILLDNDLEAEIAYIEDGPPQLLSEPPPPRTLSPGVKGLWKSVIVWQRRSKPTSTSTHGFRDGLDRSLCGIATKTSLEVWETREDSVKCSLCEQRAKVLATKGSRVVVRSVERAERERAKRIATGRKFCGQTGHTPGNEARRYVYKVLAEMMRKELAVMKGVFFDGLESPDDLRQLRYALRTIHAEMVRRGDGKH